MGSSRGSGPRSCASSAPCRPDQGLGACSPIMEHTFFLVSYYYAATLPILYFSCGVSGKHTRARRSLCKSPSNIPPVQYYLKKNGPPGVWGFSIGRKIFFSFPPLLFPTTGPAPSLSQTRYSKKSFSLNTNHYPKGLLSLLTPLPCLFDPGLQTANHMTNNHTKSVHLFFPQSPMTCVQAFYGVDVPK